MKRIKLYDVYVFDILNKLNIKESGTNCVQILERKRRLFRKTIYKVVSLQNGKIYNCTEDLLTPIPTNVVEQFLVRYPDDIPVINEIDISTINKIISITDPSDPNYINLCKLQSKMNYYAKVRYI